MMSEQAQLSCLVRQWNENRLDLFHLSEPTPDLEIEGVMRFYFQDGGEKVLTKCVRVSSTATTRAVVDALSEKFLPDLKMLSNDTYSLWEVHENGEERKLDDQEKPLLVQLMWHKDDREGRFLLRRDMSVNSPLTPQQFQETDQKSGGRFAKKKEKETRKKHQKEFVHVNSGREEAQNSDDIYKQVPFNTFTRTISNPEAVMRKRREKKLETKLKEIPDGLSIKVYGGEIVPSRPYVTILASAHERADRILQEALEKYGIERQIDEYMLIEVSSNGDEPRKSMSDLRDVDGRPIGPMECPLQQMRSNGNGYDAFLAIKRKPHDYQVPSTSVMPQSVTLPMSPNSSSSNNHLPSFMVMTSDGHLSTHRITLHDGLTEVGSDREMSNFSQHNIYLDGVEIRGRHAAIANMDGAVTLTPSTRDAYLEVNGVQIMQTEILRDGDIVRIGADNLFRFTAAQGNSGGGGGYPEMSDSRASTTRCVPSDYCSLPLNNDYYPASISGSSISSSRHEDLMLHSNNNILPYARNENINIPISIQIGDYNVWDFLLDVMSNRAAKSSEGSSFRLSPAYSLYLAMKFFHANHKPYSGQFFARIESNFKQIAQESSARDDLIFWLANASEFNHLMERDGELRATRYGKISMEIERIFNRIVAGIHGSIRSASRMMLDIHMDDRDATKDILQLFDNILRTARTCRLNAALTIQLCGHLLHMVNAFIFNNLVAVGYPPAQLTSRLGKCLQRRIETIHRFCEGMGVELAAECHLDRSRQAANLLAAQKNDVATLGSTCYKLNSLQIVHLLSSFENHEEEVPVDNDVIDRIVRLAERQADALTVDDGQRVTLEEADELNLPFLIPQDGYFVDQFQSVPEGLWQYLQTLQSKRLCHTVVMTNGQQHQQHSQQQHPSMTTSMHDTSRQQQQQQPIVRSVSQTTLTSIPTTQFGDSIGSNSSDAITRVTLRKNGGGIGLSIVAGQVNGERSIGIYVKKVVENSAAERDGRLEMGDQLLSVNGHSLINISQEDAARLMTSSGNEVTFDVRKRAAHRNGLNEWLMDSTRPILPHPIIAPSPSMANGAIASPSYQHLNGGGRSSANYEAPPSYNHRYQQQQANIQHGRPSAFAPLPSSTTIPNSHMQQHYQHHQMHQTMNDPPRHYRSNSATDLQQNDPNASFSQSSMTGSARSSVFDKLPSHYRHSTRPTVIQPARTSGAASPSALRRAAAPSPANSSNLYRPTSASNLFAPPRASGALVGYSSNAARESMQDIHRALNDLDINSPLARSTPNEDDEYRNTTSNYAHVRPSSMYGYGSTTTSPPTTSKVVPTITLSAKQHQQPTPTNNMTRINLHQQQHTRMSSQEPAIVRPAELVMPARPTQPSQPHGIAIKGAVPTAITQALQLQNNGGNVGNVRQVRSSSGLRDRLQDADVRQLEKTNIALMSFEAVNDELDQLDMKAHHMTEEETRRYRDLLNVSVEQSQARRRLADVKSPQIEREVIQKPARIETVIDDIPHSSSSVENVSPITPPESRKVQFIDQATLFAADVPVLDSPGIVGTNEIYRDPRQRRLNEIQDRKNENGGSDGAKLGFRDKQKLFMRQIGEDCQPKQRMNESSAQRQIEHEIVIQKP